MISHIFAQEFATILAEWALRPAWVGPLVMEQGLLRQVPIHLDHAYGSSKAFLGPCQEEIGGISFPSVLTSS